MSDLSAGWRRTSSSSDPVARLRTLDVGVLLLVAISYIPLLLTKPGKVGADTKTYLYLDPGRLLSRAPYMWDPNVGLGTVTHQNIGYLWPMGPYYFVMDATGIPDWVAQRLWLGSIILTAGLGVRWMLKELRWQGTGATVAAFAYALSPYLLDYAARISVILLPFAGLPWLIGLAARALRRGDWRTPAIFALVTLTVGGVNATSLVLVMVGPMLWFVHATFVTREVSVADAVRTALRITVLTAITSLWWLVGLMLQGSHGIPILRYTETYKTVAAAALAPETLRGLGYWFFYGRDGLGAWTASSITLIQALPALALSYLLPFTAFVSVLLTRWRHRVFFASIVVVGLILSVGAHPWDSPSPYGALFKVWSTSDLGLSFRSTPRAVPLIALGLSVFLGAGVAALSRWRPALHTPVAGLLLLLICLNQAPLFRGQMVDRNLLRDQELPAYRTEAADALSAGDTDTRVLEFPGIDFAAYRWGNTVDPVTPGLTDREYVARELIPYGSPASANLLNDMDQPFQSGRPDPDTLAPLARMLGIGEVMFRADLQYERFRTPRPRQTLQELLVADGLGAPVDFGTPAPNVPVSQLPLDDELEYASPSSDPDPAPVSIFPVEDPRSILRTVQATDPVVLAGDGSGIVALASSGGLQVDRPLLYAATFVDEPSTLMGLVREPGASLVVTDTNRRQARRWGSVRENDGYTERSGEVALEKDRSDNRLEVFPGQTDADQTVAEQVGGSILAASAYGNGVTYTAGDRAVNAMDGDETTAWKVAAFDKAEGNYLDITTDGPVTTDQLTLLQGQGLKNRWMTGISLTFDDGEPIPVALDQSSRISPGQLITFPEQTFSKLRITVESTDRGLLPSYKGISDVGIAEVTIPGVAPVHEVIRPPTDLLDTVGGDSLSSPLSYVFSRRAPNPGDVIVADEEPSMQRWVIGPVARAFTVFGKARLNATLIDTEADQLLGLPDAAGGGVTAESSSRLPGTLLSRASAAIDGDTTTAYRTPLNITAGNWVQYTYPQPVTIDGLDMSLLADGKHSVPTRITVSADGAPSATVDLPTVDLGDGRPSGSTTEVRADTGTMTGTTFRVAFDQVDEAASKDWFGSTRTVLPVGVAEVGLPTVVGPASSSPFEGECRTDLLEIGDEPVPVRLVGTVGEAASSQALSLDACGAAVEIPGGRTLLRTGRGTLTGIDVELVTLASAPGGTPGVDTLATPPGDGPEPPRTVTGRTGRISWQARVSDARDPYWVVLGQSYGPGWTAETSDGRSLGPPTLINGFANGWRVDPAEYGADVTINMTWAPQKFIWLGLGASALGVFLCIALIVGRPRRRRGPADTDDAPTVVPAAREIDRATAMTPVGAPPLAVDGPPLGVRPSVVAAAVTGVLALVFGGPFVGLGVAVVTLVALATRRGQTVARAACLGLFGASIAFIVGRQARNDYQVDFNWMERFEVTHAWAVAATMLLAVEVVVDAWRARSLQPDPDSPDS